MIERTRPRLAAMPGTLLSAFILSGSLFFLATNSSAASGKFNGLYFESKGAGPTLVLVHGGQLDRRMWDAQFDGFAGQYRVIRYDIRGFGKSDVPLKPYSDAEDLHALLDRLRAKKVTLIGLSLGAAIGLDFALTHSNDVNALILVCPGLGGFHFRDKANDLRPIVDAARAENFELAADLWLQNPYMSIAMENPALRTRLRQLARDNAHCWLNNPLLLRRLRFPAAERLREIRAPTLVIGGAHDVSDIHQIIAKLTSEVPNCGKTIFPNASHLVPMEEPTAFNALVLDFLGSVSAR